MIVLNFSHPLTPLQLEQTAQLTGQPIDQVLNLSVQFDPAQPFTAQMQDLIATIPLDATAWQNQPILVNPPALNFITALLLAELHGRMGYFPPILRLRPLQGSLPPRYEVAEVLNLQSVRDAARRRRY